MAARKDDWTPAALDELLDTSAPKLEARMFQLWNEPKSARIADAAVNFFIEFPLRFREQLGRRRQRRASRGSTVRRLRRSRS